jgi:hypothetical protein
MLLSVQSIKYFGRSTACYPLPMHSSLMPVFLCTLLAACASSKPNAVDEGKPSEPIDDAVVWHFDSLEQIGGHPVEVQGDPQLIDASVGKAVEFDGEDDALFLPVHPLAGAKAFTWEVYFRPDSGGAAEQRFFHLQTEGVEDRQLFETRLVEDGWYLDAFTDSGESKALMARDKIYPLDRWYHIAQVYDGKTYSSYIDGELQMSADVALLPQGEGRTSVGVRITLVDYCKGAVRLARFTKRALTPAEFLPAL